jgi:hypothetical protein
MSITAKNLIEQAFQGLNIARPTELDPADVTYGLTLLNRLLDGWNAEQRAVYGSQISTFTLTPNLNPHTIGLTANSPTLTVTVNRPESIDQANIVVGSGTSAQRYPLSLRDRQWWMNQTLPNITSTIPTDLYYEPLWPNGSLYLALVPSAAYTLELLYRVPLAQLTLNSTFTLPPGYDEAITLTLEEMLVAPYHVTDQATLTVLVKQARDARARVFSGNEQGLRLRTADPGLPIGNRTGGWNWRTGLMGARP